MNFFVQFLIALAVNVVAYLLTPKPKQPKQETRDLELPTAEAGRSIPKVWGEVTVKSPNFLYYGEKHINEYDQSI